MPNDNLPASPGTGQEQAYALERLEAAKREIKTLCEDLPAARMQVAKYLPKNKKNAQAWYESLTEHRGQLLDALAACRLCLLELEEPGAAAATEKLSGAVAAFELMTPDYQRFVGTLLAYVSKLPDGADKKVNAAIIGRLMNNVRMGYYPTDDAHVKLFARGIAFPEGVTTNLFDPCCGCGLALRRLATGNNCYTFGCEIDEGRAEEAQSRLHRVAFGSYFHSTVSLEAFHVLFLNPPYMPVINGSGRSARHEKRFLAESLDHLMIGGLLIYIIPFFRLTPDIARILCDNFEDLSVYRFMPAEFSKWHQIAVLGVRKQRENGAKLVQPLLQQAHSIDLVPELTELPENRYPLPPVEKSVQTFKGAVFNAAELERQLSQSGSIDRLVEESILDDTERRPLLPLKIGQIGLIGGSGLLNGLADCEHPHIIKGRVVKETKSYETVMKKDRNNRPLVVHHSETQSNKMILNILTPRGFQSLTQ